MIKQQSRWLFCLFYILAASMGNFEVSHVTKIVPATLIPDYELLTRQVTLTPPPIVNSYPFLPAFESEELPTQITFTRYPASFSSIPTSSIPLAPLATPSILASLPKISSVNASRLVQIDTIIFGSRDMVMAIAWSPDGNTLAVSAGEFIHWYETKTLREINRYHVGALTHSIAFSPDGRWFAAGSRDGFLRVWDGDFDAEATRVSPLLDIWAHKKGVNSVAFSPDSRILASGGNEAVARFWDPETGGRIGMAIGGSFAIPAIAFTPDGLSLAVMNGKMIRLRQVGSERIMGTIRAENPLYSIALSPDGRILATGNLDNLVQLWDTEQAFRTGQEDYPESMKLIGHDGKSGSYRALIWKVVFSPDGHLLASAGGDATIRLWDIVRGELVTILMGHVGGVTCVAFHPDARLLASGGLDSALRIWGVYE